MNKFSILQIVFWISLTVFSQKSIQKTIDFNGADIQIDLGKIDRLQLRQSDKKQVIISTTELEQEASFLKIKQQQNTLLIQSKQTNIAKPELPACIEQPLFTSYSITIPKNVKVFVTINSGNFITDNFNGFLELSVKEGEIILNHILGNVKINTIDGVIIASTNIQKIQAKSHLGKVSVNKKEKKSKHLNDLLIIETIRGNIFINTDKTP